MMNKKSAIKIYNEIEEIKKRMYKHRSEIISASELLKTWDPEVYGPTTANVLADAGLKLMIVELNHYVTVGKNLIKEKEEILVNNGYPIEGEIVTPKLLTELMK